MRIHLLHMNDVHSRLESYMRLGRQLRALRSRLHEQGEPVLTFDIGDVLDRVRPETEATMGFLNADMMAALGVNGWVFGNNEGLTIPVQDWEGLAARSNAWVFGTNLRQANGEPFPFFIDTHVYDVNGVRIGTFGLTPKYDLPYEMLQVRPLDPFACARTAVASLRSAGANIIVCLSHLGLRDDRRLAATVPGIDAILGGHSHESMPKAEYVEKTAIFQPGKHASAFGHTVIEWDGERVQQVTSTPVPVLHDSLFDTAMEEVYRRYEDRVKGILGRTVASIPERLPIVYEDESVFANLLVDVLFDECQGDLAVMMTGALNASLLPGNLTLEALLAACPTPTRPIIVSMTGRELQDAIEQGIQPETYGRLGIGFGFRGGKIGYLVIAGAVVELVDDGDRQHVRRIVHQGGELEPDRTYRIITCEYLWLSPVFGPFRSAREITYQPPLVREVLIARIAEEGRIERAKMRRYVRVSADERG
ncbi:2',3'-cyclic-nucleotide 2'-phosphodiesterase (5'-nucleotidase family) [Alicyclobacillus sacchari]|uniref:2',3'-cyclic-nucleotide 2'-phosphodiesterase (5'-nucleotidase family) n=1 Tax=Alicyclobacillus sacchari TaxID=392010 RepID=A0A4R8LMT7_9BACL|nr:bifunctional UDP-sugar hydrolase/5'-nucleotidase [Alicyclobacillus sacchari]TDY44538.1 2',3'-cyclic-nucleotide 2'-phosphodiesterase (5'-nucleotidase family) [Alicyclobacillus sacchari]GMA57881.1 putative metallophosphoesterase YunD [Alicyclobacillus sacchari]